MRRIRVGLLLCTLAFLACRDTTAPDTVSGFWTGLVAPNQVLSMTIVESNGIVSGTGTLTGTPTGTRAQTVSGTFANGTLDATFTSGSVQPFAFHAHYTVITSQGTQSIQLVGSLTGSGFGPETVTLTKFNNP